ncbi:hypothetical protein SUGI_0921510 [Cryptomeria japonica]|nr:hypothetical protein SUGI_0921510 [Cryptomeria japonica]
MEAAIITDLPDTGCCCNLMEMTYQRAHCQLEESQINLPDLIDINEFEASAKNFGSCKNIEEKSAMNSYGHEGYSTQKETSQAAKEEPINHEKYEVVGEVYNGMRDNFDGPGSDPGLRNSAMMVDGGISDLITGFVKNCNEKMEFGGNMS